MSSADDWSHEENRHDPGYADRRNFYKVEKWTRAGQRIAELFVCREQHSYGSAHL